MKFNEISTVLAVCLLMATGGCDRIKRLTAGKSSGQVVATVNGQEITRLELRDELGGFSSKDPKIMKQAQDQALQAIIVRDLLSQRAIEQKLDKVPFYTLNARRSGRNLLAKMYEQKLFQSVLPPTKQEAENYVVNHPEKYAKRRIYILDQIVTSVKPLAGQDFKLIKSLDEVKSMLTAKDIIYEQTMAAMDTVTADHDSIQRMDGLPPNEVFYFEQNGAYVFNVISLVRNAPVHGELATRFAMEELRKIQAEDFVRSQIVSVRVAAEPGITYGKGYQLDRPDAGIRSVTAAAAANDAAEATAANAKK